MSEILDANTTPDSPGILWLCGQCVDWKTQRWEFQGVFSTKAKALTICRVNYFVYPVAVDEPCPHESCEVPHTKVLWPHGVSQEAYEGGRV